MFFFTTEPWWVYLFMLVVISFMFHLHRLYGTHTALLVAVLPDFAQVYGFIGSVFDPNVTGHLHNLKKMDPIDVETVCSWTLLFFFSIVISLLFTTSLNNFTIWKFIYFSFWFFFQVLLLMRNLAINLTSPSFEEHVSAVSEKQLCLLIAACFFTSSGFYYIMYLCRVMHLNLKHFTTWTISCVEWRQWSLFKSHSKVAFLVLSSVAFPVFSSVGSYCKPNSILDKACPRKKIASMNNWP